ncbi:AbrB/MazE/SpoVT family DNA-binding domain-containing protein [Salana multivorans]
MITTIDKAGRIVVPKAIRDAMGLTTGAKVDISYADGRIEIEYAPNEFRVDLLEDGFPVIVPLQEMEPVTDEDLRRIEDDIQAERVRRVLG